METEYRLTLNDEPILITTDAFSACDAFRSTVSMARRIGHNVSYRAFTIDSIDQGVIDHANIDDNVLILSKHQVSETPYIHQRTTREVIKVRAEKKKAKKRSS